MTNPSTRRSFHANKLPFDPTGKKARPPQPEAKTRGKKDHYIRTEKGPYLWRVCVELKVASRHSLLRPPRVSQPRLFRDRHCFPGYTCSRHVVPRLVQVCLFFFYLPIDTKACFATVFISLRIYFGLASGRTALPLRVSPRLAFRSVRRGHS